MPRRWKCFDIEHCGAWYFWCDHYPTRPIGSGSANIPRSSHTGNAGDYGGNDFHQLVRVHLFHTGWLGRRGKFGILHIPLIPVALGCVFLRQIPRNTNCCHTFVSRGGFNIVFRVRCNTTDVIAFRHHLPDLRTVEATG